MNFDWNARVVVVRRLRGENAPEPETIIDAVKRVRAMPRWRQEECTIQSHSPADPRCIYIASQFDDLIEGAVADRLIPA